MEDGHLLNEMGVDGLKWAEKFCDKFGIEGHIDESLMLGWFANAIEAGRSAGTYPIAINDDLIAILGRPNFSCHEFAIALRGEGVLIHNKAEHEQAHVLHWMLGIYLEHGSDWKAQVGVELDRMAKAAKERIRGNPGRPLPPHGSGP